MKKIFLAFILILIAVTVKSQAITKDTYLHKSRTQHTWAAVLTGNGIALAVAGIILLSDNPSYIPNHILGPVFIGAGSAGIGGGILLFSASKRNAIKAGEITVKFNFDIEHAQLIALSTHIVPSMKICFAIK